MSVILSAALLAVPGYAGERSVQTTADVYQWWDPGANPVGTAKLVRDSSGLTAIVQTSELPAGSAVTLWFIIFNNPEHCSSDPCSLPQDIFVPEVEGDFHFGSGQVIGGSGTATFAGHLSVGDTTGSGRSEVGFGPAMPLVDPYKVQVVLAVHVHGPKQTGQDLKSQINSYLGGCLIFLGPDGFAASPADVPDQFGECSTTQLSRP